MCGIAGIISKDSKGYQGSIEKMIKALNHRGPDDNGFFCFNECLLGHTRLSLVDLMGGKQPMLSNDSSLGVVFNGEIYGFADIKKSIKSYNFKTDSDTELLLALYERYNIGMLEKLPGMFSFAIWDNNKKEIFCGRDRFGEKPFYYAIGKNNEFIFASEMKSILESSLIEPIIDNDSLSYYLKRLSVPSNKTIYKNIFVLPPACYLVYKNYKIEIKKYWSLPPQNNFISMEDAVVEFRSLFEKAVENFMIADVPVGAFLSGGLDSSTVVGVASKYKKNIKTFSFGFDDESNELHYAKEIAVKYKTDHTEIREKESNIANLIFEMQNIYDEPFSDPSNIPTYLISKEASKSVKTILTGDGADELLGGYDYWYKNLIYFEKYKDNKFLSNKLSLFLVKALNKATNDKLGNLSYIKRGIDFNLNFDSLIDAHINQTNTFSDKDLVSIGLNKKTSKINSFKYTSNTIDDALRYDVENFLPSDILIKTDRASMATGLELRSPFLDVNFSSFCISLPNNFKISENSNKTILRKAYSGLWTQNIRKRGKQGFGKNVSEWFKLLDVLEMKSNFLENKDRKLFELISFENTQEFVKKNNIQTWALLNLSIWLETRK